MKSRWHPDEALYRVRMGNFLWTAVLGKAGEVVSVKERFGGQVIAHDASSVLFVAALQDPVPAIAGQVTDRMKGYVQS